MKVGVCIRVSAEDQVREGYFLRYRESILSHLLSAKVRIIILTG